MKLFSLLALALSTPAFAATIHCESLDENVGGGNIKIDIAAARKVRGLDGHAYKVFPVTASNENERVTKQFEGSGTASEDGVNLMLLVEGDIAVGFIRAETRTPAGLSGIVSIQGVAQNEQVSCSVKR